jgi:glycosyltransferase involved in cell wall biosynthesis
MRVLHCIWRMNVGGAERQLILLSEELLRRGMEVHVVTAFPGDNDAPLAATGATLHRLDPAGRYDPTLPLRLAGLVRRLRPDVMHTWLTQMDILGGTAASIGGIPWALSERSSRAAYPPGLLNRTRSLIGARADAVIANSPGGREYWKERIAPERITVIPNIVPRAAIQAAPLAVSGAGDGDEVVLYVGRFSAEKNLDRLVDALALVIAQRPAVRAVFCGDGPLRPAIEAQARARGIGGRALFAGRVDDVWSWMKRASALVAVSIFEGDPNAVLEAMAARTPLVLSDIAAHRALVDESSARLVEGESVQSIAAGILGALTDREDAAARASRAAARIGERAAAQIAARYEEVYRNMTRSA